MATKNTPNKDLPAFEGDLEEQGLITIPMLTRMVEQRIRAVTVTLNPGSSGRPSEVTKDGITYNAELPHIKKWLASGDYLKPGPPPSPPPIPITQEQAANYCRVTSRTIRAWEKGQNTPEGYPGRNVKKEIFLEWALSYLTQKEDNAQKRNINHAKKIGDSEIFNGKIIPKNRK